MLRLVSFVLLLGAAACESPVIVTTNVTAPTPITYSAPAGTPTATCPTGNCGSPCAAGATCTGSPQLPGGTRAPEVLSFGADTNRISKGSAAVLRWEVSDFNAQVRIDPGIGSVGTVGFLLVNPTQTTTYTLTARNSLGTAQRTLTVFVFTPE